MSLTVGTILIADDEPDILEFLRYNFESAGYLVHTAADGESAIALAMKEKPQLIILDVMMPGMDGIEVCRLLREKPEFEDCIVIFLTARNEDYSEIAGFTAGADDYVTKPIRPRVLITRIKSMLSRKQTGNSERRIIKVGATTLDVERMLVYKSGKHINLPKKEYELLYLLLSDPGKTFTREEIYRKVWGTDIVVGERTLDVHIRKLREKLGDEEILTMKGVGYRYNHR